MHSQSTPHTHVGTHFLYNARNKEKSEPYWPYNEDIAGHLEAHKTALKVKASNAIITSLCGLCGY